MDGLAVAGYPAAVNPFVGLDDFEAGWFQAEAEIPRANFFFEGGGPGQTALLVNGGGKDHFVAELFLLTVQLQQGAQGRGQGAFVIAGAPSPDFLFLDMTNKGTLHA